ncbi:Hypothetical predicted protein, partial [Mytilus galloprovincialis]
MSVVLWTCYTNLVTAISSELYLIIIVVFHVQRKYKANIIPGQNPFDQRSDFISIGDSGTLETTFNLVEESGVDTGSAFGFLPIPFVSIALLMMAFGMLIMPSSVTSRASVEPRPIEPRPDVQLFLATQAATALAPTPAPAQTTPCIPTNCPADYTLLDDRTASQNCYLYSGNTEEVWSDALKACALTPGAYLWRPNIRAEADAVKNKFGIGNDVHIWTGANSPTHDENFVFAVDNAVLSLVDLPFGVLDEDGNIGEDCVEIEFDTNSGKTDDWEWENNDCDDEYEYICELPRDKNEDTYNVIHDRNPNSRRKIDEIKDTLLLLDPWRTCYPSDRKFTWRQKSPIKQSRLDYYLVSEDLLTLMESTKIIPGYRTDHSAIIFTFTAKRGKGYWKFNSQLLREPAYGDLVINCIRDTVSEYFSGGDFEDFLHVQLSCSDQLFLEVLKMKIRSLTISYCIKKSREEKDVFKGLELEIQSLENSVNLNPSEINVTSLNQKKCELEKRRQTLVEGLILRSR